MQRQPIVVFENYQYVQQKNIADSIKMNYFQLLVDDLLVWTGILDKMNDNEYQVPFNTILFSNERILTEHERHTVLEYIISIEI